MVDGDFEDIFKLSGYLEALKYLIAVATDELGAGVTPETVLVRFHVKASRLRRLEGASKRIRRKRAR